ncbi:MAG: hypothetical protein WC530_01585 [Candidatus Omnitrophota bacterium]|jgi:uncharacterized protein (DUF2384 family)
MAPRQFFGRPKNRVCPGKLQHTGKLCPAHPKTGCEETLKNLLPVIRALLVVQLMLERNDELIGRFNKNEQKYRSLQRRKRARRKQLPHASKKLHRLFDLFDKAIEKRESADCISKKWIG